MESFESEPIDPRDFFFALFQSQDCERGLCIAIASAAQWSSDGAAFSGCVLPAWAGVESALPKAGHGLMRIDSLAAWEIQEADPSAADWACDLLDGGFGWSASMQRRIDEIHHEDFDGRRPSGTALVLPAVEAWALESAASAPRAPSIQPRRV